ncbi:LysR family transcriptional regulator [Duganella violaceipulchra]|uniref:DNA-binding transcriptional LysR family regulator n=1 Tax=Duganella violaceipulchra TaxID=2849652 RepID=A0AA41L688_9BURK|nr:LysR family transcriptional regulator [Duganella violaceicalia]MBV6323052.1 LysR family transcriptional regulator [Duganella violaceicalia]MCP2010162.1 DNA-binding transcriptional LysR family regulator [Duganella violaceicalia]
MVHDGTTFTNDIEVIANMHQVDLSTLDLNLLKLFEALVRERSVTQAGLRLGLSQPAASRALARLRTMLGDRLVVRGKLGLELTPRGEALAGPVAKLLDDARGIISPAIFDPASATGRISIAAHDHLSLMVLAGLMARFERHAPALSLHIAQPVGDNVRLIEQGGADLALGIFKALPGSFHRRGLYADSLVCVTRSGHPCLADGLSLERYMGLRHIAVTISGVGESAVDVALSALGLTRQVALRVPHFLAAAMLVADSDMILTLPGRLARLLAQRLPLALLDLPLQVAPLSPAMIWHERFHRDPAHAWVRQQLVDVVAALNTVA